MMLNSWNEWDPLREVVVGTATNANWPTNDPVFAKESETTSWKKTPPPSGAVPQWVIDETNEDLEILVNTLEKLGVVVYRPHDMDFQKLGGMYNYCPRDRLIIAGDTVVDTAMMYPCRDMESYALDFVFLKANNIIRMPRDRGFILDAANILRMNDRWLALISKSGNFPAIDWLQEAINPLNIMIETCSFYGGVHIDSTISLLREGLAVVNESRISRDQVNINYVPTFLNGWDIIWVNEMVEQSFYQYPYASKWIGMNMLSVSPDTVIVDAAQTDLIKQIEQKGITVIPLTLRHSRTLGGGFHCVTLDLVRQTKY